MIYLVLNGIGLLSLLILILKKGEQSYENPKRIQGSKAIVKYMSSGQAFRAVMVKIILAGHDGT